VKLRRRRDKGGMKYRYEEKIKKREAERHNE
jgi:hypothetical protein